MIINDKYKFVFIHIPKTGGSSLRLALSDLPGNNTGLTLQRTKHETASELVKRLGRKVCVEQLTGYWWFGFVRNPWARIQSLYRYLVTDKPILEAGELRDFQSFLSQIADREAWVMKLHSMRSQADFLSGIPSDLAPQVTHFRYEEFSPGVAEIEKRIGVRLKVSCVNKTLHLPIDTPYSNSDFKLVERCFASDIERFGYQVKTLSKGA